MADISNEMEHLVRREIDRRRGARSWLRRQCWCPQCVADVSALALNRLPPRYCRAMNVGCAPSEGFGARVAGAVEHAVAKVAQRPRHRPGAAAKRPAEARCEDFALKIAQTAVGASFASLEGACACAGCQADALALALNRYRPKYGVSGPGRTNYQEHYADFIRHEILPLLATACRIVSADPHR